MNNSAMGDENPNNVLTVKITITHTILLIIAMLVLAFANFYCGEKTHQAIVFFLLLIGGACQVSLAVYSLKNLQLSTHAQNQSLIRLRQQEEKLEQQRKADKSANFASRWNDPSMFVTRNVCREITECNGNEDAVKHLLDNDPKKATCARHVLNFLEELSVAVHSEYCDEYHVKTLFNGIVINMWGSTASWVRAQRAKRGRPSIWSETEKLYNRWK